LALDGNEKRQQLDNNEQRQRQQQQWDGELLALEWKEGLEFIKDPAPGERVYRKVDVRELYQLMRPTHLSEFNFNLVMVVECLCGRPGNEWIGPFRNQAAAICSLLLSFVTDQAEFIVTDDRLLRICRFSNILDQMTKLRYPYWPLEEGQVAKVKLLAREHAKILICQLGEDLALAKCLDEIDQGSVKLYSKEEAELHWSTAVEFIRSNKK